MFTDAQFRLTNFRVAYCLLLVTFYVKVIILSCSFSCVSSFTHSSLQYLLRLFRYGLSIRLNACCTHPRTAKGVQRVCKYVRGRMEASFPTHYFFECRCISHSKLAQRPSTRRKFTWLVVWFNIITLTVTHFTRENWSRARASVSISVLLRCSGTSCDADIPPTHL